MKECIIVRHGHDVVGQLSSVGKKQIEALVPKLKPYINGKRVRMICSRENRAHDSGKILAENFNVPLELNGELNPPTRYNLGWAEHYGGGVDVLIIIAHHDTCRYLPEDYAKKFQLRDFGTLDNGQACVVDFETKKLTRIP